MAKQRFSILILVLVSIVNATIAQQNGNTTSNSTIINLPTDQAALATLGGGTGEFLPPGMNLTYGLAPQFSQPGSRLANNGTGTVAYSETPIASNGAMTLGCGAGCKLIFFLFSSILDAINYCYTNADVEPYFQAAYVGVSPAFFQQGFGCGRCIQIQCDDNSCLPTPGFKMVATVLDQCPECEAADLFLAYPLFQNLTGRSPSANPSIAISWEFVDCSPYINGTIKMLVKPGGTAYYQAFNFANSRQVITAVQVNGELLKHGTDNYWSWNPSRGAINPRGLFDFALLGANKQVLRARVPQLRSVDLGIQFAAAAVAAPAQEKPVLVVDLESVAPAPAP